MCVLRTGGKFIRSRIPHALYRVYFQDVEEIREEHHQVLLHGTTRNRAINFTNLDSSEPPTLSYRWRPRASCERRRRANISRRSLLRDRDCAGCPARWEGTRLSIPSTSTPRGSKTRPELLDQRRRRGPSDLLLSAGWVTSVCLPRNKY